MLFEFTGICSGRDRAESQNDDHVHHLERLVYPVMVLPIQVHQSVWVPLIWMNVRHHHQALKIGTCICKKNTFIILTGYQKKETENCKRDYWTEFKNEILWEIRVVSVTMILYILIVFTELNIFSLFLSLSLTYTSVLIFICVFTIFQSTQNSGNAYIGQFKSKRFIGSRLGTWFQIEKLWKSTCLVNETCRSEIELKNGKAMLSQVKLTNQHQNPSPYFETWPQAPWPSSSPKICVK